MPAPLPDSEAEGLEEVLELVLLLLPEELELELPLLPVRCVRVRRKPRRGTYEDPVVEDPEDLDVGEEWEPPLVAEESLDSVESLGEDVSLESAAVVAVSEPLVK